jgi:hypothetical protein
MARCAEESPRLRDAGSGHMVACHLAPIAVVPRRQPEALAC